MANGCRRCKVGNFLDRLRWRFTQCILLHDAMRHTAERPCSSTTCQFEGPNRLDVPNYDEVTAPARRLRLFTGVFLVAAVLLVFGAPIACVLVGRTAGDKSRMAMAAIAAELIGFGISGAAVDILKKARAQGSSRSPTRFALAVARVAFWDSILLAALLSLAALFFLVMSFGLSG